MSGVLWAIWPSIALLIWTCFNIGFIFYLGSTKLDVLEKCLEGSKWVSDSQTVFGGGITGRSIRLHIVFWIILLPAPCYWRGLAGKNAAKKIPRRLRSVVIVAHASLHCNGVTAFVLGEFFSDF